MVFLDMICQEGLREEIRQKVFEGLNYEHRKKCMVKVCSGSFGSHHHFDTKGWPV